MENPIKMDDLGVPLFFGNIHVNFKTNSMIFLLSELAEFSPTVAAQELRNWQDPQEDPR